MRKFNEIIELTADYLNSEKIPYMFVGPIAVSYYQQSFLRRVQVESFNKDIWLCAPEDAIISKLMYGSPKDILDAKGILLRLKNKLDYDYLKKIL